MPGSLRLQQPVPSREAVFAGSAKSHANTAFATGAAITAAVVVGGGGGRSSASCDRGGDGGGPGEWIIRLDYYARHSTLPYMRVDSWRRRRR